LAAKAELSDEGKRDIQQFVDWTEQYADLLDPLSNLSEAVAEFLDPKPAHF